MHKSSMKRAGNKNKRWMMTAASSRYYYMYHMITEKEEEVVAVEFGRQCCQVFHFEILQNRVKNGTKVPLLLYSNYNQLVAFLKTLIL